VTIRKLPPPAKGHVETGAFQFGDGWPGLFVRGGECMALAHYIQSVLAVQTPEEAPGIGLGGATLRESAETIERDVLIDAGNSSPDGMCWKRQWTGHELAIIPALGDIRFAAQVSQARVSWTICNSTQVEEQ
jgi:hypothetical protein